jgi:CubicO group peptidase (beta-lactamase class C family)
MAGRSTLHSRRDVLTIAGAAFACPAIVRRAWADKSSFGPPAGAPLNVARLAAIDAYFRNEVAGGTIPGAIVRIERGGNIIYDGIFGLRDVVAQTPMTPDTIFRIYSMTKPIASAAAMMAIEAGQLSLTDPVAKFIPSFANVMVGIEAKDSDAVQLKLVDPARAITVRDLLLHTSGITYGFYGSGLVRKAYNDARIYDGDIDSSEFVERLARLPLREQPGSLWDYGHSTDVLARIIEIVSGQPFAKVLQERFLDPLAMRDTAYAVTDDGKWPLIAEPLPRDADFRTGFERNPKKLRRWQSGGSGLVSTVGDYSRFARMLLQRGALDGRRYLNDASFVAMTSDQIGPSSGVGRDWAYFPGDGFGFGYGFGVRTDPGRAVPAPAGSAGEIKWDGAAGTYFFVDFRQDMLAVLMMQSPSERERIKPALKRMIYDAFDA